MSKLTREENLGSFHPSSPLLGLSIGSLAHIPANKMGMLNAVIDMLKLYSPSLHNPMSHNVFGILHSTQLSI